jgi:prolyl oligopeptidase
LNHKSQVASISVIRISQANDASIPSTVALPPPANGGLRAMEGKPTQKGTESETASTNRSAVELPKPEGRKLGTTSVTPAKDGAAPGTTLPAAPEPDGSPDQEGDPYNWLNDARGARALDWARQQSSRTLAILTKDSRYSALLERARAVAFDKSRIFGSDSSTVELRDGWIYDIWFDEQHPHGIWRRASFESIKSRDPHWDPLLDIADIGRRDGKNYFLFPGPCVRTRCMLGFSEGGGPTLTTWKEFDVEKRSFVDGGFVIDRKHTEKTDNTSLTWKDENTLLVCTDFGPGSLNIKNGAPMVAKEWRRGRPLSEAREVLRADPNGTYTVGVQSFVNTFGKRLAFVRVHAIDNTLSYWLVRNGAKPVRTNLPSARLWGVVDDQILLTPTRDWKIGKQTLPADALIAMSVKDLTSSSPQVQVVMQRANVREKIEAVQLTRSGAIVFGFQNVRGRLWRVSHAASKWAREQLTVPDYGSVSQALRTTSFGEIALVRYESFLQAPSLLAVDLASNRVSTLMSTRARFNSDSYITEQLEATSEDGTRIPYFFVHPKSFAYTGDAPTIVHAYGSNGASAYPWYSGYVNELWFAQGGTYVVPNIRGGGEFGAHWHVTGAERKKTYADFAAVIADLTRRRITSPAHLGIAGHSAGGLLVGVMITQRPSLFGAALMEAPLLDQLFLNRGGPRKTIEYGSPDDPEVMKFLTSTSPFQNLRNSSEYPIPLIVTSTTDDDVPPSLARRFAAKMERLAMPMHFFETDDGGHGITATQADRARYEAMKYEYFLRRLSDLEPRGRSAN